MLRLQGSSLLRNIRLFAQVNSQYNLTFMSTGDGAESAESFAGDFYAPGTPSVKLEQTINDDLENGHYKPKAHPGRVQLKHITVPERIVEAIKKCLEGKYNRVHWIFKLHEAYAYFSSKFRTE